MTEQARVINVLSDADRPVCFNDANSDSCVGGSKCRHNQDRAEKIARPSVRANILALYLKELAAEGTSPQHPRL